MFLLRAFLHLLRINGLNLKRIPKNISSQSAGSKRTHHAAIFVSCNKLVTTRSRSVGHAPTTRRRNPAHRVPERSRWRRQRGAFFSNEKELLHPHTSGGADIRRLFGPMRPRCPVGPKDRQFAGRRRRPMLPAYIADGRRSHEVLVDLPAMQDCLPGSVLAV